MLHEMDYNIAKWVRSTDDPAVIHILKKDKDEMDISVNKTITPVVKDGRQGDFDPDVDSDESDEVDIGFWKQDYRPFAPSKNSRANAEASDSDLLNGDLLAAASEVQTSQESESIRKWNYDEDAPLIDL